MIIRAKAFPRAALVGNPSDGYFGKTIAFVFKNYYAQAELYESPELDLLPSLRDHNTFESMDDLYQDIQLYGYYGGIRLLKGAIKKFCEYVRKNHFQIEQRNFTLRYKSTIPNRLGLAGSSAIITAAMRCLCKFYEVGIPPAEFANLVLSVEKDELGIPAGLQDRVAQSFNHPVYMDFDRKYMERNGVGKYSLIDLPEDLPIYIAYRTDLAEGSEVLHSRLRHDFNDGVEHVVNAMQEWANLTDKVRSALAEHRYEDVGKYLDRNFDLRCEVCSDAVSDKNRRMVEVARKAGASAKFTGSGGAIIGLYRDENTYQKLSEMLREEHVEVIKPEIVTDPREAWK